MSGLLIFTVGCYQYLPAGVDAPLSVGQDVRVLVTIPEAERLRLSDLLPGSGTTVDAKVISSDQSGVEVQIPIGSVGRSPLGERELVQRISIQRNGIQRLDFREIDKGRTWAAAVGIGATLIAFVVASFSGSSSGGGPPADSGDKVQIRIPLP